MPRSAAAPRNSLVSGSAAATSKTPATATAAPTMRARRSRNSRQAGASRRPRTADARPPRCTRWDPSSRTMNTSRDSVISTNATDGPGSRPSSPTGSTITWLRARFRLFIVACADQHRRVGDDGGAQRGGQTSSRSAHARPCTGPAARTAARCASHGAPARHAQPCRAARLSCVIDTDQCAQRRRRCARRAWASRYGIPARRVRIAARTPRRTPTRRSTCRPCRNRSSA